MVDGRQSNGTKYAQQDDAPPELPVLPRTTSGIKLQLPSVSPRIAGCQRLVFPVDSRLMARRQMEGKAMVDHVA